ncbi:hypothetical protein CsSME_00046572 [Camellia sinensis var. sinensis]
MASRKLALFSRPHNSSADRISAEGAIEKADFSGQYAIKFQPQTAIKAQALADFVVEFAPGTHPVYPIDLAQAGEQTNVVSADLAQPEAIVLPKESMLLSSLMSTKLSVEMKAAQQ